MLEKTNLAIVIPCYNEEQNVQLFTQELRSFIESWSRFNDPASFQVFIVNNNSTDRTAKLLSELAQEFKSCLRVEFCEKKGYGAALKHGFKKAENFQYIGFLDFDNTYPMKSLIEMYAIIQSKKIDLIYGVRLHEYSQIDFLRRVGNLFYVYIVRILFSTNLTDACSGMRIFHRKHLKTILSAENEDLSFSIELTLMMINQKWSSEEFLIEYRDRTGHSKLNILNDGLKFLFVILKAFGQKCFK